MKYIIIALILLQVTVANPYISAILYDPAGSDEGNEWIEFYNPTNLTIDFQEYELYTSNGRSDWQQIDLQGQIPKQSYFLLGESNMSADHITELGLVNIRGAVKFAKKNQTLSIIGWGDLDNDSFYQINPAVSARDRPLVKTNDTFENRLSYNPQLHYTPSNSFTQIQDTNQTQIRELEAYFQVQNSKPQLTLKHILSHEMKDGLIQYFPATNQNLTIRLALFDMNQITDLTHIEFQTSAQTITQTLNYTDNQTNVLEIFRIPLTPQMQSGFQNITITLTDSELESHSLQIPINVIPLIGLDVAEEIIYFTQNGDYYTTNITLSNTGSIPVKISFLKPYLIESQIPIELVHISNNTIIQPNTEEIISIDAQITQPTQKGSYKADFKMVVNTI